MPELSLKLRKTVMANMSQRKCGDRSIFRFYTVMGKRHDFFSFIFISQHKFYVLRLSSVGTLHPCFVQRVVTPTWGRDNATI